jgi:hypothetical protein
MPKLIHEIWECAEDDGILHMCCLAGPRGEDCRRTEPNARLLATFEAGSHFEAMTIYNRYLYREEYKPIPGEDYLPYPEEWYQEQNASRRQEETKP